MSFNSDLSESWLTFRLSTPISPEHRSHLIDALATWNFKPHRLDDSDLYRVACLIFEAILHTEGIIELGLDQGSSSLPPKRSLLIR